MAETKKKTTGKSGKKSAGKTQKKSPEKKAKSKQPEMPALEEPVSSEEQAIQEEREVPARIYSVSLFAVGIFTTLLIFVQGSAMWKTLHELLKGLFGIPSLLIPAGLFWFSFQIDKQKNKDILGKQLKFLILTLLFFSCFLEIMFGNGTLLRYHFFDCFSILRQNGIAWQGGGMVSALAYPVQILFGEIGAKIVMCLLLFVYIMLSTKKSLSELFAMIRKPFRDFGEFIRDDRKDAKFISDYEEETEAQQEQNEQEALAIAQQSGNLLALPQEENALALDIPVSEEPAKIDIKGREEFFETSHKVKVRKKSKENMPSEEEQLELFPSLEELISHAADTSKKKKKEQEMLEIADEISQQANQIYPEQYQMPKIEFLESGKSHADDPNLMEELRDNANQLCEVLKSFNVEVNIMDIARGPSVTRYEVRPAAGIKVSKITNLSDDIALNLAAEGVRIEAPIPGKAAVGIEVPNSQKDTVSHPRGACIL